MLFFVFAALLIEGEPVKGKFYNIFQTTLSKWKKSMELFYCKQRDPQLFAYINAFSIPRMVRVIGVLKKHAPERGEVTPVLPSSAKLYLARKTK